LLAVVTVGLQAAGTASRWAGATQCAATCWLAHAHAHARQRARRIQSLTDAVVLLASFIVTEARSDHALMPLRIFRTRDPSAANLIVLFVGTARVRHVLLPGDFVQTGLPRVSWRL
jgi:hypothetical protein